MHIDNIDKATRERFLSYFKDRDVVICAHDKADVDAMTSAEIMRRILVHENICAKVVRRTLADAGSLDIVAREGLMATPYEMILSEIPEGAAVILCDWFSIPNADPDTDIVAIFDHHPSENVPDAPICFEKPASSTSRLLYQLFFGNNIEDFAIGWDDEEMDEIILGTLYASFIDTNGLKSTRTDSDDFGWMDLVITQYGLDKQHLVEVGMDITDLAKPVEELIYNGEKNYVLPNGKRAFMSYIIVDGYDGHLDRALREELVYVLQHDTDGDGKPFDYAWLLVCDLGKDMTYVCKSAATDSGVEWHWDEYEGNLSRATDVYPMLEATNLE